MTTFDDRLDMSDTSNGQHLVNYFHDRFARIVDQGEVRVWRETHWEGDESGDYMRGLMIQLTEIMKGQARIRADSASDAVEAAGDDKGKQSAAAALVKAAEKFAAWVTASRQDSHVRGSIRAAVAHPGVRTKSGIWDAQPDLFNTLSGTIELHPDGSHTLREHKQEDRLTQIADVEYDPDATSPQLDAFLKHAFPCPDVRLLVRALAGVTLVGRNHGQRIVLLLGKTRTGKSRLVNLLKAVLGNASDESLSYSATFDLADLRPRPNGAPNPEMVKLLPRRYICATEANGGAPLNADTLKRFVGDDGIAARDAYAGSRSIIDRRPAFVPWVATNRVPEMDSADEALLRRIVVLPMNEQVDPANRVEGIDRKIVSEEGPGVLNWLLAGYRDAMANPTVLTELPEVCRAAAISTAADLSVYARWLADCTEACACQARDEASGCKDCVTVDDSWNEFLYTAKESNEDLRQLTKRRFGAEMHEAGHLSRQVKIDGRNVKVRAGLVFSAEYRHLIGSRDDGPGAPGGRRLRSVDGGGFSVA